MENKEDFKNRLFLLTIIGKELTDILLDLDKLYDTFFKDYQETVIQYGNCLYFSSPKTTSEIHEELSASMGDNFAYVVVDITDNLNVYDFKGNITKTHALSDKFLKLIEEFTSSKKEEKVEELTLEEQLQDAVDAEDFKLAAELRDLINDPIV